MQSLTSSLRRARNTSERVRLVRGFFFPGSNQRKALVFSLWVIGAYAVMIPIMIFFHR